MTPTLYDKCSCPIASVDLQTAGVRSVSCGVVSLDARFSALARSACRCRLASQRRQISDSHRAVRAALALKSLTSHQFNFLWLRDPTDAPCRDSLRFRPTRSIPAIHFAKPSHEGLASALFSTRESIENREIFNPDAQSRHHCEGSTCTSQSPTPGVPDSTFEVPMVLAKHSITQTEAQE